MLAALLVVLMGAAVVAAAFFWLGSREAPVSGPPELIQAPPGPYKVKPPNPGGLDISAESETAFETSAGEDRDAQLDASKLPNATAAKPTEEPKADASAKPAEPPKPEPAPEPKATGGTCSVYQPGSFADKQMADR